MDLIRELLLRLEALPHRQGEAHFLTTTDEPFAGAHTDANAIAYNLGLIVNAGFLDLTRTQPADGIGFFGITWKGHEFLDSVRDPEIWRKTKEGAQKAGGATFDLLIDLAKGLIKTQIRKHTGVEI